MADDRQRDVSTRTIVRVAAALILLGVLVAFVLDNRHSVEVGFVFTDKRPPLIWILVLTAVLGALLDRLFVWLRRRR